MLFSKFDMAAATAFGAALRIARIGDNETQTTLAARTGLTSKRLSLIERGRCAVRPAERAALYVAFPTLAIAPREPRPAFVQGVPAGMWAPKPPVPSDPEPHA